MIESNKVRLDFTLPFGAVGAGGRVHVSTTLLVDADSDPESLAAELLPVFSALAIAEKERELD